MDLLSGRTKALAEAKEAREQLAAATQQLAEAEATITDLQSQVEKLTGEVDAALVTIETQEAEIKSSKELADAADKRAKAAEEKAKAIEDGASAKASATAQNILAATGHPPLEIAPNANPTGKPAGSLMEQLASIEDPKERTKFIRANREKLFTEARTTKK